MSSPLEFLSIEFDDEVDAEFFARHGFAYRAGRTIDASRCVRFLAGREVDIHGVSLASVTVDAPRRRRRGRPTRSK